MLGNRRYTRIREFIDASWSVEGLPESGEGQIINISLSGALLQTDRLFVPQDKCVMDITIDGKDGPFTHKKGKVVWFRRVNTSRQFFQCGIDFGLESTQDGNFRNWIDAKVTNMSQASNVNILNNYVV